MKVNMLLIFLFVFVICAIAIVPFIYKESFNKKQMKPYIEMLGAEASRGRDLLREKHIASFNSNINSNATYVRSVMKSGLVTQKLWILEINGHKYLAFNGGICHMADCCSSK